jgi:isocitrate lyase
MGTISQQAANLRREWETDLRWADIERPYSAEDVIRLRGSVVEEHTLARNGANRLWELLHTEDSVRALGALTGNQAVQMVKAGLQAIYLSGWQVAADANLAGHTYPDQSLYPANSVPQVVRRINNALLRADQISWSESEGSDTERQWLAPIVADAEAGFGGVLNAFELMKGMISAGAAGVHFEDQLSSEKKCGHLGGKVLIPTGQHIKTLTAARLAADVLNVPSLVIARRRARRLPADLRRGRAGPPVRDRGADGRRVLPRPQRHGAVHRARPRLRPVLRTAVDGDLEPGPRRGAAVRRGDQGAVPGPDARLQLLPVVQLEQAPG